MLGGPSLAEAALPADLEQSLVYAPARLDAPAPDARYAQVGASLAPDAFCPLRPTRSTTTLAHGAGFAAVSLLAARFGRRRPKRG